MLLEMAVPGMAECFHGLGTVTTVEQLGEATVTQRPRRKQNVPHGFLCKACIFVERLHTVEPGLRAL